MSFEEENQEEMQPGSQMSFMEHLDEVRKRLIRSLIIVAIAFCVCLYFSENIYRFLAVPVQKALAEAKRRDVPEQGLTGNEKIIQLNEVKEGDKGRYVFERATKLGSTDIGPAVVSAGTSVNSVVAKDNTGNIGLYTDEQIFTNNAVIPTGIKLPIDLQKLQNEPSDSERMVVTTPMEPFTLYVTVSLYASIALALPFLLFQVWGFISPALYKHERSYVTPFIFLSTVSFVIGAAFAYYVLFPPAVRYLIGVGSEFQVLLNATNVFDFITLIMLAMGLIFQMPAIAYVLARIGLISAGLLVRVWKIALIVILIVAAVASPTADIPNMMLFAAPMIGLYIVSIFVAWFFGKKRSTDGIQ